MMLIFWWNCSAIAARYDGVMGTHASLPLVLNQRRATLKLHHPSPSPLIQSPSKAQSIISSNPAMSIKARPYDWPHNASLNPRTTALVVIDMQVDCKLPLRIGTSPSLTPFSLLTWGISRLSWHLDPTYAGCYTSYTITARGISQRRLSDLSHA